MTCDECGRWYPADRETGYDADSYCSAECEEDAEAFDQEESAREEVRVEEERAHEEEEADQ